MTSLKILWHDNYYDIPLSGMAELNGEKVHFEICPKSQNNFVSIINIQHLRSKESPVTNMINMDGGEQLFNEIANKHPEITEALKKVDINSNEFEIQTEWFILSNELNVLYIEPRIKYDLYRLSPEELEYRIKKHREFQENVGYSTDYDSNIYQKYIESEKSKAYFNRVREPEPSFPPREYLGTYDYNQFER